MLGHIATKIFSAGFHIEPRAPEITKLIHILLRTERSVLLPRYQRKLANPNLSFSFVCLAVGRPPLLGPNIQISNNNEGADANFFSGLFRIITTVLCAQRNPTVDFDELWQSIWSTHARLRSYWEEHEPILRSEHADPHRPWNADEALALNANCECDLGC